jgi:hypothetical protein
MTFLQNKQKGFSLSGEAAFAHPPATFADPIEAGMRC